MSTLLEKKRCFRVSSKTIVTELEYVEKADDSRFGLIKALIGFRSNGNTY